MPPKEIVFLKTRSWVQRFITDSRHTFVLRAIASHVDWANSNMVDHSSDLRDFLLPSAPAAVLANDASTDASPRVVAAYKAYNDCPFLKRLFLRLVVLNRL